MVLVISTCPDLIVAAAAGTKDAPYENAGTFKSWHLHSLQWRLLIAGIFVVETFKAERGFFEKLPTRTFPQEALKNRDQIRWTLMVEAEPFEPTNTNNWTVTSSAAIRLMVDSVERCEHRNVLHTRCTLEHRRRSDGGTCLLLNSLAIFGQTSAGSAISNLEGLVVL